MRDFIRKNHFNYFPKLFIISYRTDVDVSKIVLFGPKQKESHSNSFVYYMRFLSQHFSLSGTYRYFRYSGTFSFKGLHNLDRFMIVLLNYLVMNSPWFALKKFFYYRCVLIQNFIENAKKMLKF